MARPKLRPEERSDEQLPNIRVTVAERERVEEKAAAAGMTVTQYIRRAVLKTRIAPKRGSTDQALLVELNRVGTNLNQIARRVNAGRNLPSDFPDVLAEVSAAVKKVLSDGS